MVADGDACLTTLQALSNVPVNSPSTGIFAGRVNGNRMTMRTGDAENPEIIDACASQRPACGATQPWQVGAGQDMPFHEFDTLTT